MGRVAHQRPAKQGAGPSIGANAGLRGQKVGKQRNKHKIVIESTSNDQSQGKARAVLSFHTDPPPGYTFIPAGNPQLTSALKDFANRGKHRIYAVTSTPHASRHELSREVHRIGFHFPTEVVAQVCNYYGIQLTSSGKLVQEKEDDKLFMKLYQRGQLALDAQVRDQVTINTEAKQIITDLFPNIPDNDLFKIIKTAFQLGDNKVGTADEIPLVRRAQLSVVAHIRHTYTSYDKLLRQVPYSEARHRVEKETLEKLVAWRGDGDDNHNAVEDTLREVVVISDEDDTDEDVDNGHVVEHDVDVQPIHEFSRPAISTSRRASPVESLSDDDAPRGYRYLPQVVRRVPLQNRPTMAASRQQVWDRIRQDYRAGHQSLRPAQVVERVVIDDPGLPREPVSYMASHSIQSPQASAPFHMADPPLRVVRKESPPAFIRDADGKLYERIVPRPPFSHALPSPRRVLSPRPITYGQSAVSSRPTSPPPYRPQAQRRMDSFEQGDGVILPSIEGPNGVYSSPAHRRVDIDHFGPQQHTGVEEYDPRRPELADINIDMAYPGKRRRIVKTPPSPYLRRDKAQTDLHVSNPQVELEYPLERHYRRENWPGPSHHPHPDPDRSSHYVASSVRTSPRPALREHYPEHPNYQVVSPRQDHASLQPLSARDNGPSKPIYPAMADIHSARVRYEPLQPPDVERSAHGTRLERVPNDAQQLRSDYPQDWERPIYLGQPIVRQAVSEHMVLHGNTASYSNVDTRPVRYAPQQAATSYSTTRTAAHSTLPTW